MQAVDLSQSSFGSGSQASEASSASEVNGAGKRPRRPSLASHAVVLSPSSSQV